MFRLISTTWYSSPAYPRSWHRVVTADASRNCQFGKPEAVCQWTPSTGRHRTPFPAKYQEKAFSEGAPCMRLELRIRFKSGGYVAGSRRIRTAAQGSHIEPIRGCTTAHGVRMVIRERPTNDFMLFFPRMSPGPVDATSPAAAPHCNGARPHQTCDLERGQCRSAASQSQRSTASPWGLKGSCFYLIDGSPLALDGPPEAEAQRGRCLGWKEAWHLVHV